MWSVFPAPEPQQHFLPLYQAHSWTFCNNQSTANLNQLILSKQLYTEEIQELRQTLQLKKARNVSTPAVWAADAVPARGGK